MDRLDALRLFVRVVALTNFSAAAREAGIGQSAVSKCIAGLEQEVGARLLQRTSRSLFLTKAGQVYLEGATRLIADFDELQSSVGSSQTTPVGHVRMTVAPVFGRLYIVPRLPEFLRLHPGITIEIAVSDRHVALIEEGFDIALRHGDLSDSGLTARRLASAPSVTVAAPAYLAGRSAPSQPHDLDQHVCLVRSRQGQPGSWMFQGPYGPLEYRPHGSFMTTDGEQLHAATLSGMGVAHGPKWLYAREIASGDLIPLLEKYERTAKLVHAVHPFGRRPPARVRAVIDFLASTFACEPALQ